MMTDGIGRGKTANVHQASYRNVIPLIGHHAEWNEEEICSNHLYLALEWMPGGNLYDLFIFSRSQSIEYRRKWTMMMDIARGMEYIHSQRVIHCDLKLHNLVLNQQHRVKIADFEHSVLIDAMDQRIEDHRKIVFGGSMATELCTEYDDDGTVIFHRFDRKIDDFSFEVIL